MSTFGKKLQTLRKSRNLSQEEVALNTNTTKSTISKYEHNTIDPTLSSAKKIASFFGVSLSWLAGEDDTEPEYIISAEYAEIIKQALKNNITPSQLSLALELLLSAKSKP